MHRELAIVEVTASFYEPGETFEDVYNQVWKEDLETAADFASENDIQNSDAVLWLRTEQEPLLKMLVPNIGLYLRFVGEGIFHNFNQGGYTSAVEADCCEISVRDALHYSLPKVFAAAQEIRNQKPTPWRIGNASSEDVKPPKTVTFLTLWECNSWYSFEGEYDSSLDYLGVFKIESLPAILEKEVSE